MTRVVNGREEAIAALQAGALALESPPYAACHAGVNYYRALLDMLQADFPDAHFTFTLCCGDDPAIAHDALRLGFTSIRCACSEGMLSQLREIANEMGAVVSK